ncbi:MAG: hypothetical protein K1X75_16895 [Leptospirales bacterium]|nr:hypothetical protein [Leptospirales bacterium]
MRIILAASGLAALATFAMLLSGCRKHESESVAEENSPPPPHFNTPPSYVDAVVVAEDVELIKDARTAMLDEAKVDYQTPLRQEIIPQLRKLDIAMHSGDLQQVIGCISPDDLADITGTADPTEQAAILMPLLPQQESLGPAKKLSNLWALRTRLNERPLRWSVSPWPEGRPSTLKAFVVSMRIVESDAVPWPPLALTLVYTRQSNGEYRITLDYSVENQLEGI